jgi:4-diphosphocytidyl-2-C-methyl-D-erythritol kinase
VAQRLVVPAPAKVNLFLHVTGRRADGYHTLESLFALIDLADTLTVARRTDGRVQRIGDVSGVATAEDLAWRAASALKQASGTSFGVDYALDKRIPLGAGLGGGSSDAASMLLALNRLWGLDWPRGELARIALTLGADVPFFVGGHAAIARGIGEHLTPVSLPGLWLLVAVPPVQVPTAAMFAASELTRDTPSAKMNVFSAVYGRNDLEPVAAARFPEVASALADLRAIAPQARMTGSGAALFAAFGSAWEARAAAMRCVRQDVRVVRTLARHPLASFA